MANEKIEKELIKNKRINKVEDNIKLRNEEIKIYNEEKKLNLPKKFEKDRCLLVKKNGKDLKMEEVLETRSIYDKKNLENKKEIKKILTKVVFKKGNIEEENKRARDAIKEADKKVEELSSFFRRSENKENRIYNEAEETKLLVEGVNEKQGELEDALAMFDSVLKD